MHHLEALSLAHTEFAQRLAQVGNDHWDLPTPCSDWSVRQLVDHVVGGYPLYMDRLGGDPVTDVDGWYERWERPGTSTADYEAAFFAAGNVFEDHYGNPSSIDAPVPHPAFGVIPGGALLSLRVFDMTIHAWDLARSIGVSEDLDPGLVALLWEQWSPSAGQFGSQVTMGPGPSGTVDTDAPLQHQLLDLLGRRP